MPVTIRNFTSGDTGQVAALWQTTGVLTPGRDPAADISDCLTSGRGGILVAEKQGGLCATVMCGHDHKRGWLYYVAVAPAFQGRGLGAQILAAGEDWVRSRGFHLCSLTVAEEARHNVRYYLRHGYAVEPNSSEHRRAQGVILTKTLAKSRVHPL